MSKQNEKILIDRCINGDIEAFEELISDYEKKVFNIALRIIGNYNDAEDISQEIFIKVFKSIKNFKGNSSFYTWLYRIVVNECFDIAKKKKKVLAFSIDTPIVTGDDEVQRDIKDRSKLPEEEFENKELRKEIQKALNMISNEHRTMIVLRDVQGFSYDEISEMLKCPPGTVKSRINRARKALKELLSEQKELLLKQKV
jgi:RNA polymerase sigma-70 factor (ECF subfamily)